MKKQPRGASVVRDDDVGQCGYWIFRILSSENLLLSRLCLPIRMVQCIDKSTREFLKHSGITRVGEILLQKRCQKNAVRAALRSLGVPIEMGDDALACVFVENLMCEAEAQGKTEVNSADLLQTMRVKVMRGEFAQAIPDG